MTSSRTTSQFALPAHDRVMHRHGRESLALVAWVFLAATSAPAQTHVGPDIDGEAAADRSGHSVALSSTLGTIAPYGSGCTLTLTASAAPCIPNGFGSGTTVDLIVGGIPTTAFTNFIVYNFVPIPLGLDLALVGAPGCFLYVANPALYASHAATSSATDVFPTDAPWVFDSLSWSGVPVRFQAGSFVPPTSANPLGLLTSNALTLTAY
jgi:hypothetical protein